MLVSAYQSPVVKTLLSIMEHGVKPHSKHLTEYFAFLYEFAKMGEEEVEYRQHRRHEYTHTTASTVDTSTHTTASTVDTSTHTLLPAP